ncbi:MFS transporter [Deinococcus sp.]|uniref:MFS transporter n=1 Tax=Deinococcus sp. TaxID=47478 RepID=UPI0025FD6F67|nr:MFS transporter [Deinococcus sp.]
MSFSLTRLERAYSAVVFCHWFGVILPGAVMVLYAQARGLSLAEIGLYGAVQSATAALFELPTGNLADRAGRKRAALGGAALLALSTGALLVSASLPGFVLYAVLGGLARALSSGALDAWFVDRVRALAPDADLQPRLARLNTTELLALGLGPLAGAALPVLWRGLKLGGDPMSVVIAASLLVNLLTLALIWTRIHDPERPQTAHPQTDHPQTNVVPALRAGLSSLPTALKEAAHSVRRDSLLPRLLLLEALGGVVVAACQTFWQPFFADQLGLGRTNTLVFGGVLGGCFLAGMVGNLVAARTLAGLGGRLDWLGRLSQGAQALALLLLAWSGSVWAAAGLLWLLYLVRTVPMSSLTALYNERIPSERRSLMLSVLSVAFFIGVTLGNLGLGVLAEQTSVRVAWTVTAGVLLLSVGLFKKLDRTEVQAEQSATVQKP